MNTDLTTKELDMKIRGKDGDVKTKYIQKHKSTSKTLYIKTDTNNFIICQENHPLYILRGNEIIEIEASEVNKYTDKIWVDNSICFNDFNIDPGEDSYNVLRDIIDIESEFCMSTETNESRTKLLDNHDKYTFCLLPEFIQYNKEWVIKFINFFVKYCEKHNFYETRSYYFALQLKYLCDRIGYDYIIDIETDGFDMIYTIIINKNDKFNKIRDYVNIKEVEYCNYSGYLYDIKTETKEFLLNSVQNHNSFHTGAALVMNKIHIRDDMMRTVDEVFRDVVFKSLYEENEVLYCSSLEPITVRINKLFYNDKYSFKRDDNIINLDIGYLSIVINDHLTIQTEFEFPIELYIEDNILLDTKELIVLEYKFKQKMFKALNIQVSPEKTANKIGDFVGGVSPYLSPLNMYNKFFKLLKPMGNWDSVHLECIISNIFRNKNNPQIPARLKEPYDPVLFSIKRLPSIISYPLGIAFEDFNKSVQYGLISERSDPSDVEKVIFGESLVGEIYKK